MLTQCPECQKEVSTAATQCPHCGAPLGGGRAVPVAKPVSPGYAPGGPQGMPGMQPPPQSHCLRNCLVGGCLTIVILGLAIGIGGWIWFNKHFPRDPQVVARIGQELAPGAKKPAGYNEVIALDLTVSGVKMRGAMIANGDINPQSTLIMWGGFDTQKTKVTREQLQKEFDKALAAAAGGGVPANQDQNRPQQIEKSEEIELDVGGEKTKVMHLISVDQRTGNRQSQYVVLLEPWDNEFGFLGVGGIGPEQSFDLEGFKTFLASLKRKQ